MGSFARIVPVLVLAVIGSIASSGTARAHHTYVTKYDAGRKMTLTGTLTSVRYANPHIFFHVRVKSGQIWKVETESIPKARAKGLTRGRLKMGAQVTVTGWPARNGKTQLGLSSIRLPDGVSVTMRGTAR